MRKGLQMSSYSAQLREEQQAVSQLAAQRANLQAVERRVSAINAQVKQALAQAEVSDSGHLPASCPRKRSLPDRQTGSVAILSFRILWITLNIILSYQRSRQA